jgi:hypothetical protein
MVAIVVCEAGGFTEKNNHRMCSERRLLFKLELVAKREGCKGHRISEWIRKKCGGSIKIWRRTADGELANATPCLFCAKTIEKHGLHVICSVGPTEWYIGPVPDTCKFTRNQKLQMENHVTFPLILHY